MVEEKRCSDCYILINSEDAYYSSTMLCNGCYLKNKRENTISNQSKEEKEKIKKEWLENLEATGGKLSD